MVGKGKGKAKGVLKKCRMRNPLQILSFCFGALILTLAAERLETFYIVYSSYVYACIVSIYSNYFRMNKSTS